MAIPFDICEHTALVSAMPPMPYGKGGKAIIPEL